MSNWNGEVSQEELMRSDECIMVDDNDNVVGHISKAQAHAFSLDEPRGSLHRAFSVFLFNSEGQLLLQQRAANKITFPNVWTNTCCSHPLYPNEVDDDDSIQSGSVQGIKSAAVRKLEQELGIPPESIPIDQLKFLTRLHYWAADTVTHGASSPWGEHEIDYILFIQANVSISLNADEVQAVKYVTKAELLTMMNDSELIWSPWFRIIADTFLPHWWTDLNTTLSTNKFVDTKSIYRFDPSPEHMGGAGNAEPAYGKAKYLVSDTIGNTSLKQGAYGKVKIHEHSKLSQLLHLDEIFAAFWFKYAVSMPNKVTATDEATLFCDDMLGKVSRSFASVIRQLPKNLCLDILVFYLVLRALDTIEDDMEAFKGREDVKLNHLNTFHEVLGQEGWHMNDVGGGDEKVLLEKYYHCVTVFNRLSVPSREVITDICKRMGQGMASFAKIDLGQGTVTVADYDMYCHYVAGLVGEGLSRLFTCCGYESEAVGNVSKTLANTMGLFLQKTNIIRDYLEDYVDGRAFWPQEVWKKYSKTGDLGEFANAGSLKSAVHCLNDLITDALECVPECIQYMNMLRTEEVFRFCAIPQVMAISTLSELYNNPDVFTGVVKIRKGTAAKLILDTKTMDGLYKWFYLYAKSIKSRIPKDDPSAEYTHAICDHIISSTEDRAITAISMAYGLVVNSIAPVAIVLMAHYLYHRSVKLGRFILMTSDATELTEADLFGASLLLFSLTFMLFFSVFASRKRDKLKRADP